MAREPLAIPVGGAGIVDTHLAKVGQQCPGGDPRERRLSCARRPDYSQYFARRERQRDILEHKRLAARIAHGHPDQLEASLGVGQHQPRRAACVGVDEQLFKRRERAARLGQRRPLPDDLLARLECAAEQHRGGNDRADRNLAPDREQRADPERERLHEHAHELDLDIVSRAGKLQLRTLGQAIEAMEAEPPDNRLAHAQRADQFGVARRRILRAIGRIIGATAER